MYKNRKSWMELGRSMVEMLGVLAVIGVLSIVGLQGYKQAMLKHHANETWDAVQKFAVMANEYLLAHPEAVGDVSVYLNSGCNAATHCIDARELLPSYANNTYNNFMIAARLQPTNRTPYINVYNIKKNGVCRAMMPNGTASKEGNDKDVRLTQKINGIDWMCSIYYKNGTSEYEL